MYWTAYVHCFVASLPTLSFAVSVRVFGPTVLVSTEPETFDHDADGHTHDNDPPCRSC